MRKGEDKCRILEMHLKLRDQQLKTISCVCVSINTHRPLYQNPWIHVP